MDDYMTRKAEDEQHNGNVVHAFTDAENVSLVNSRINVIGGNMYYNVPHIQLTDNLQGIADWLSPIDFGTTQSDTLSKKTPGTGQWFVRSRTFAKWLSDDAGILWVVGMPGSGKTILASIVIDHLQTSVLRQKGAAVVYCYIRYTDRYSIRDFLASLVKQLIKLCPSVPSGVETLYNDHATKGRRLSEEELFDLFRYLSQLFNKVYLLLDALDEMPDDPRSKLLRMLSSLNLNLLLTSRVMDLPRDLLRKPTPFSIEAHHTEKDIALFITTAIQARANIAHVVHGDDSLLTLTYSKLKEKSRGMFLAAALHIEALATCTTKNEFRDAVESLPSSTEDMYKSTLHRIQAQNEKFASLATRAIIWLTHACRSLEITELQHALAVSHEMQLFNNDDVTPEELIVSSCCGLIVVDRRSRVVRLAHYTAYDFFKRMASGLFSAPHSLIVTSCIAYLSAFKFRKNEMRWWHQLDDFLKEGHLLPYAHKYWGSHAHECYAEPDPPKAILTKFILNPFRYPVLEEYRIALFEPCHIAAYYDLPDILKLIHNSYNSRTSDHRTPLILASQMGHEVVIRQLVSSKKVHINSQDPEGNTGLIEASKNGHERIVELLLAEKDIKINIQSISGNSALIVASKNGHHAIVKLLLAYRRFPLWNQLGARFSPQEVEINARNADGNTALILACQNGQEEIVRLLLARRQIDINAKNYPAATALIVASQNGHEEIVRRLLSFPEIDVMASNKSGDTALLLACMNGHKGVAQLLLSHPEININVLNRVGHTALISACENGDRAIVELLLSRQEVDVNINRGTTALTQATQKGHKDIVELLLSQHAIDINALVKYGMTALMIACAYHRREIFPLLFSRPELDVNVKDESGSTALSWSHDFEFLEKLLSLAKLDVNVRDEQGCTPLIRASAVGHQKIVKLLLLRAELDVNVQDKSAYTSLIQASENGHENIVRMLLSRAEIEINACDQDGNSALLRACQKNRKRIVKFLLAHKDIAVNERNKSGETALTLACRKGHTAILKSLLAHRSIAVNLKNDAGETPLTLTCKKGQKVIVGLLLTSSKVAVNGNNTSGDIALTLACQNGHKAVVKLLLAHKEIAVNARNKSGYTALRIAHENGDSAMVRTLLSHPDVNISEGRILEKRVLNPGSLNRKSIVQSYPEVEITNSEFEADTESTSDNASLTHSSGNRLYIIPSSAYLTA